MCNNFSSWNKQYFHLIQPISSPVNHMKLFGSDPTAFSHINKLVNGADTFLMSLLFSAWNNFRRTKCTVMHRVNHRKWILTAELLCSNLPNSFFILFFQIDELCCCRLQYNIVVVFVDANLNPLEKQLGYSPLDVSYNCFITSTILFHITLYSEAA